MFVTSLKDSIRYFNRIEQNRIEQNRIEYNRIEQNRIEQNRIEQNSILLLKTKTSWKKMQRPLWGMEVTSQRKKWDGSKDPMTPQGVLIYHYT